MGVWGYPAGLGRRITLSRPPPPLLTHPAPRLPPTAPQPT